MSNKADEIKNEIATLTQALASSKKQITDLDKSIANAKDSASKGSLEKQKAGLMSASKEQEKKIEKLKGELKAV